MIAFADVDRVDGSLRFYASKKPLCIEGNFKLCIQNKHRTGSLFSVEIRVHSANERNGSTQIYHPVRPCLFLRWPIITRKGNTNLCKRLKPGR